jgi:hemolysin D
MDDASLHRSHARLTMGTLALVGTAIVVSIVAEVDIAATGIGRLIPDGQAKIVQSFETGFVSEILVDDGSRVEAGDILIRLDTRDAAADERRVRTDLAVAQVELARLKATIDYDKEEPFAPPPGSPDYAIMASESLMRNQINELNAAIAQIDADIQEKEATVASTLIAIRKDQELLPIQREREEMRARLMAKDVMPRLTYLDDKEKLVTLEMDLAAQKSKLNEVQAALESLRQKRSNLILKFRSDRMTELVEAQRKALTVAENYAKAEESLRRHTIVAPISGTIQDSIIHTVGGVVTLTDNLMTIVPTDSKLIVEALIANKDIGFVQVGQAAELKITTFDYRLYGTVTGRVRMLSRDTINNEPSSTKNKLVKPTKTAELKKLVPAIDEGPIFRAEIVLDQTMMRVDGKDTELSSGMTVEVNILTSRRRIIDFFLAPFRSYQSDAFRERI